MNPTDKEIWDAALFKQLSKGIKALPSMAIATTKYDEYNHPKQAKYRIVVLGNRDYHHWSRNQLLPQLYPN
jgi:hypothetical protein